MTIWWHDLITKLRKLWRLITMTAHCFHSCGLPGSRCANFPDNINNNIAPVFAIHYSRAPVSDYWETFVRITGCIGKMVELLELSPLHIWASVLLSAALDIAFILFSWKLQIRILQHREYTEAGWESRETHNTHLRRTELCSAESSQVSCLLFVSPTVPQ